MNRMMYAVLAIASFIWLSFLLYSGCIAAPPTVLTSVVLLVVAMTSSLILVVTLGRALSNTIDKYLDEHA